MNQRGKRYLTLGAQGLTLGALVVGTVAFVGADKTVALTVDGNTQDVRTFGSTVADVLRAGHVDVDAQDSVSAPLDSTVSDGSSVRVLLARDVTVEVDGRDRTVTTTAQTVGELADQLGVDADSKLSLDSGMQLASAHTTLAVTTPKHVTLDLAGQKKTVDTTALDVDELLDDLGVKTDKDDKLSPRPNTVVTDGLKVRWVDVEHKKATKTDAVDFETKKVEDKKLERGKTKTTTKGVEGERTTTYDVLYENGKAVSRKKTSAKVTTKPVTEVIAVGTKKKEQPKPEAKSSSKASSSKASTAKAKASSGSVSGVWAKMAQCESGGNWAANTGNGYYGGLQFTASTWAAQGGTKYAALPSQASASEQIAIASKLQKAAGWGQWPACASKLGLR